MLKIIAAVAENRVIGKAGGLPWHLPDDMKWFKERTGSDPVAMGSKTFNLLPDRFRPLPGRLNIIISRDTWNWMETDRVTATDNFDEIVERSKNEDVWVIGGAEIYTLALPHAFELYMTRVHGEPEGDVFFPAWNPAEWILGWEHCREADEKHVYARTWQVYFRDTPIYQFANTRLHEQRRVMFESLARDECPFCPEGLGKTHVSPVVWRGKHWLITPNDYPYKDTAGRELARENHLLIIPTSHVEKLSEISSEGWEEFGKVASQLEDVYGLDGVGLTNRSGNPLRTGSSIKHLHFHAIAPNLGSVITFPIGCYATSKITPP
jgi:dihydrofolate reductase